MQLINQSFFLNNSLHSLKEISRAIQISIDIWFAQFWVRCGTISQQSYLNPPY